MAFEPLKPMDFAKALERLFEINPHIPIQDAAERIGKSPQWIHERLGLLKLCSKLQEAVDAGNVSLSVAYMLSKLPVLEQLRLYDFAISMSSKDFIAKHYLRVWRRGTSMLVKCERDNTRFFAIIQPYLTAEKQSTNYDPKGDRFIECPTCARRYFWEPEAQQWESDRPLTILQYGARKYEKPRTGPDPAEQR